MTIKIILSFQSDSDNVVFLQQRLENYSVKVSLQQMKS